MYGPMPLALFHDRDRHPAIGRALDLDMRVLDRDAYGHPPRL